MASHKKESRGDRVKVGAGGAVVFAGGAIMGAALLYGAKKLYEYMTDDAKPSPMGSPHCSTSRFSQRNGPVGAEVPVLLTSEVAAENVPETLPKSAPASGSPPASPSLSPSSTESSLHHCLLQYYTEYVEIDEAEMEEASEIVDSLKNLFWQHAEELLPNHTILGLAEVGSTVEGLDVIRPEEFDIVIVLGLDSAMWELVDASETLHRADGYFLVKRKHRDFFALGTTPYDKYLVGDYLCPEKVKSVFFEMTHRVGKWGNLYRVQADVIGPSPKLIVQSGNKNLNIEFIPAVLLDGKRVVARPHPATQDNSAFRNLWQRRFVEEEVERLDSGGTADAKNKEAEAGPSSSPRLCHLTCLKLLKAIRLNHPAQLGALNVYMIKTLILHLLDAEDDWSEALIGERFLDVLKALEAHLKGRSLPHYFYPNLNLLATVDPEVVDYMHEFITRIIGEGQFHSLLKTVY